MAFKSGFERTLDMQLKRARVKYSYETLKIPYILNCEYNPDFILDNGIIIEAKGRLQPEERRKHLAVKDQNPGLDIRFVFYDAEKKMPKTKTTHAVWASKNGFIWADKEIPVEWLKEKKNPK